MSKPVYRHELKFYITSASADLLKRRLSLVLRTDNHAAETGDYYIRSLYFDDMFSTAYFDKIEGLQDREKYRIRFYNLKKDYIALEKKVKNDDLVYKKSVVINERLCEDIINKNLNYCMDKNDLLLREFFAEVLTKNLRPRILVDYFRTAYEYPAGDVRITIDENLKTALWNTSLYDENLPLIPVLNAGEAILEIKYNRVIPEHVIKLLDCVNKDRCAISKYTLCSRYLH